jgi:Ni/Co efflux regulator RcnB
MRKFLALLLLSSAALPTSALAATGERGGDRGWSSRSESSDRQSRSEDSNRAERSHSDNGTRGDSGDHRPQPTIQVQESRGSDSTQTRNDSNNGGDHSRRAFGFEQGGGNDHPQVHNDSGNGGGNSAPRRQSFGGWRQVQSQDNDGGGREAPAIVQSGGRDRSTSDTVRNWHGPKIVEVGGSSPGSLRQLDRPLPRVMQGRTPVVSQIPREGTQPPLRAESRNHNRTGNWTSWNHNWRDDNRYDWRSWRNHHRSHFHLSFYYDPFGWSYRPYSIGWRLWPSYYSSRYWISDPWEYRLPYAPPGYRWIRYWDDALLVDTFTGEVVDVIHNFFW